MYEVQNYDIVRMSTAILKKEKIGCRRLSISREMNGGLFIYSHKGFAIDFFCSESPSVLEEWNVKRHFISSLAY